MATKTSTSGGRGVRPQQNLDASKTVPFWSERWNETALPLITKRSETKYRRNMYIPRNHRHLQLSKDMPLHRPSLSLSLSLLFAFRLTSPLIHPQFAPTGIYIWVVLLRKPGAINSPFLSALNVTRRRIKLRPPEEQASSENRSENGVNRRASPLSPLFLFLFFSFFYVRINVANGRIFIFRANVRLVPSKGEKAVSYLPKICRSLSLSLSLECNIVSSQVGRIRLRFGGFFLKKLGNLAALSPALCSLSRRSSRGSFEHGCSPRYF